MTSTLLVKSGIFVIIIIIFNFIIIFNSFIYTQLRQKYIVVCKLQKYCNIKKNLY